MTGISPWECDCFHQQIYSNPYGPFQENMPTFWSTASTTGINLFATCAAFETARTTYGIALGSSTYFGSYCCPTLTPTPTVTPTITPTTPSIYSGQYIYYSGRYFKYIDGVDNEVFALWFSSDNGYTFSYREFEGTDQYGYGEYQFGIANMGFQGERLYLTSKEFTDFPPIAPATADLNYFSNNGGQTYDFQYRTPFTAYANNMSDNERVIVNVGVAGGLTISGVSTSTGYTYISTDYGANYTQNSYKTYSQPFPAPANQRNGGLKDITHDSL
jgi:hypothetical protein